MGRSFFLAGAYLGIIGGYTVARTGLDKKAVQAFRNCQEEFMRRNARIELEESLRIMRALSGSEETPVNAS